MPVKRIVPLRKVGNVAASKTAVIEIPLDFARCHRILLQHGYASGTNTIAAAMTNIGEIRQIVNGTVIRTASGTQLRDLHLGNGTQFESTGAPNTGAGVSLPLFYSEPWREGAAAKEQYAWATKNMTSFNIEVDLGAASTPLLAAYAIVDDLVPEGNPLFVKHIRASNIASGTSFDIVPEARGVLQQMSFYIDSGGSNTITKVTFRQGGKIISETLALANAANLNQSGMTPAASGRTSGIWDYVPDMDDSLGSSVNLAKIASSFTIEAGGAMSGNTVSLMQRLEALDNT